MRYRPATRVRRLRVVLFRLVGVVVVGGLTLTDASSRASSWSMNSAITAALNAAVPFRDVQDFAGHADPRITRRDDRSRHHLDRRATYALASRLGRGLSRRLATTNF